MPGRRIYLVGSSGYPHHGDEVIARAWLSHLARTEPTAEVWLDCPNPGGAQLFLGGLHPNLRFVDTFFQIGWHAPSDDPQAIVDFASEATRSPGFGYAHRARGVEIARSADVVHVIGGAYVNGIWPRHLGVLAAGKTLAEEYDVRVAATGQTLVPAGGSAELLDSLTSSYAVVDTADAASRSLLSSASATMTGDDVWLALAGDAAGVFDDRESPSTMVCMQSDLVEDVDGGVETLAAGVLQTMQAWGVAGEKMGYIEAIPGQDRAVFELLERELPGIRFYPFTEVWDAGLPARRGQRWLTTRPGLHALAAAAGAWGVAYPVKPGYDEPVHRSIVEQGSRWVVGTPGETAPESHGEHGFGRAADDMAAAKAEVARTIYG